MKRLTLAAVLLAGTAFTALPASAATIEVFGGVNWTITANTAQLTLVNTPPPGGQVDNIPCIICGTNQPQQFQDFGFNNYKQGGEIGSFQAFSDATATHGGVALNNDVQGTAYSATFLRAFAVALAGAGADFNIGIDVNSAGGQNTPETLLRFAVLDVANHNVLAFYNAGEQMPVPNNNGTGFPNYFLTGFDINRNDFCGGVLIGCNTPQIEFVAQWSNATDGAESFFLSPVAAPGPLAGAGIPGLVAACSGLFGFNWLRRRRNGAALPVA